MPTHEEISCVAGSPCDSPNFLPENTHANNEVAHNETKDHAISTVFDWVETAKSHKG